MNRALSFILALAVAAPGSLQKANATPQSQNGKSHIVHFVVINMSGMAREVHHRGDTVPLPIAARVPLQVPQETAFRSPATPTTKSKMS